MSDTLFVVQLILFLGFLVLHELAHGYTAWCLGDDTPKRHGRLTLNPFKHLSMAGTAVFLVTGMVGWANPVPVSFDKLGAKRVGLVALAGPAANGLLAILFTLVLKVYYSLGQSFFHGLFVSDTGKTLLFLLFTGVKLNVWLAVFNLVPLLPLDGGRILNGILVALFGDRTSFESPAMEYAGLAALVAFISMGMVGKVLLPVCDKIFGFLV